MGGEEVKYCKVDYDPETVAGPFCETHDALAEHCAPNGDDRVCGEYAKALGCSCCSENYPEHFAEIRIRTEDLRSFLAAIAPIAFVNELVKHYFGNLNDQLPEKE